MKTAPYWSEYKVIATGDGEKLERWGEYTLLRPDPQVIWHAKKPLASYKGIDAYYTRSATGGGAWNFNREIPEEFNVSWRDLTFKLKLMGFKHTGLFPEQAVNWDRMSALIKEAGREIKVLNLFAYTGAATVACLKAGASVCHVDGAKAMNVRAGENAELSGVRSAEARYITDDCFKFCERELRRGKKYDAVILDPPSFGRGPNGEKWKIEEGISELVSLVASLLSVNPLFVCLNSYTTGLQPTVMANLLKLALPSGAVIDADEIGLETQEGLVLPQGCTAFATFA
jgi:23S rRNA (cytosine1962-C5)-methyltransferase